VKRLEEVTLRSFSRLLLLVLISILAVSGSAFASGFSIFEQGAKATGMAGAFAATADDPSAMFYNVAGIAQQRHTAFMIGGTTINFANQFAGDPNDPFTSGTSGRYRHHTFIPPNAYVLMPIGSNLTVGVGVFTPYGLRTNWEDPWVGRFSSRDANLKALSAQPSIAWQSTSGTIAIGAGAEYRRAKVELSSNRGAINPFTGRVVDVANAYLKSDWHAKWGWNLGVLLKPTPTFRIGASYRTAMDIDLNGTAQITQISTGSPQLDAIVKAGLTPNQPISTTIPFPATAILGVATSAIPSWDIEADVTHTTWSRFKALPINFLTTPAASVVRPQNWHDTYSYRLGANKKATANADIRLGVVYDRNPQPIAGVSPLLPDSDRIGICLGLGLHHGPWVLDVSDMVLHFKQRGTNGQNNENFNGTYKTDANLIGVNLGYRF
jgi:long-chain fatty acid transport protein